MVDILWVRGSGPTRAVVVAAVAGLVLLAWVNRFIQDDAFISFRYAENLVRGEGLVWNQGERVEGYSNFLWTILIAGGMKLGFEPVLLSQVLGVALYAFTLSCSFLLARLLLQSGLPSP
jgi:arabinofuranosyltransferase